MKAFNNDNLVAKLCGGCSCDAFNPVVNYAVGTSTVVITQSTTFDAGDGLNAVLVAVYDKNGRERLARMTGAGSGATVGTATFGGGAVLTIPVTGGGSGYTAPPSVVITGGGGTGATAVANVNASGAVTSITIVSGGTGYASAPTVTLNTTSATVNIVGLDPVGLCIKATLVSNGGCKADLSQSNIGTTALTGTLGNVNEQGDNVNPGNN
jgi:hypothetical protein